MCVSYLDCGAIPPLLFFATQASVAAEKRRTPNVLNTGYGFAAFKT
jgi:hypothetical protein